jgi:hypothetical protein
VSEAKYSKAVISERLLQLAIEMELIGVVMDDYRDESEWAKHRDELIGAAAMARQWAREIDER